MATGDPAPLLDGWTSRRRPDPIEVTLIDPSGQVAAVVTPEARISKPAKAALKAIGWEERYEEASMDRWREAGATVPDFGRGTVTLADGSTTSLGGGRPRGPWRWALDRTMTLRGRAYRYAHTSERTARIKRDGDVIADLWDSSARRRPADAVPVALVRSAYARVVDALDDTDELAVALFLDVGGPPGRPGAWRALAKAAWHDAVNP